MSVHGEYARALEAVITSLRAIDHPERDALIESFSAARPSQCPDLSQAARGAMASLDRLTEKVRMPAGATRIQDVAKHLRGHCHAILGL